MEDETDHAALCAHVLRRRAGCSVVRERTGRGAIGRLKTGAFDVLVLDLKMPGSSGLEVLEYRKRMRKEVPTLILTGLLVSEEGLAKLGYRVGAIRNKPIDVSELIEVIFELAKGTTHV